jgi:hypothetical protein
MNGILRITRFAALALTIVLGAAGCGHSSSADSAGSDDSDVGLTNADKEARSIGMAELQKHWLKGPDGWTTAVVSGSPYAPDHFLRQCRAFVADTVRPENLTEADNLNGIAWDGQITLKPTSCREVGGQPGMVLDGMGSFGPVKHPGKWSEWVEFTPGPVRLTKTKSGWQYRWDGSYLRGTLPGPQDFVSAGVR